MICILFYLKTEKKIAVIFKLVISNKTPDFWFSLIWPLWGSLFQTRAKLDGFLPVIAGL